MANFYLLKLEAFKIEDSPPAPLLTLTVEPGEPPLPPNERYRFWASLLERMKKGTDLFANISPSSSIWIYKSAGRSGLGFQFVIHEHDGLVLFAINRTTRGENKEIFDKLSTLKDEVESKFAEKLEWRRGDEIKASSIGKTITIGGYRDEDKRSEMQDAMIDAMIRLERVIRPHIDKLKI